MRRKKNLSFVPVPLSLSGIRPPPPPPTPCHDEDLMEEPADDASMENGSDAEEQTAAPLMMKRIGADKLRPYVYPDGFQRGDTPQFILEKYFREFRDRNPGSQNMLPGWAIRNFKDQLAACKACRKRRGTSNSGDRGREVEINNREAGSGAEGGEREGQNAGGGEACFCRCYDEGARGARCGLAFYLSGARPTWMPVAVEENVEDYSAYYLLASRVDYISNLMTVARLPARIRHALATHLDTHLLLCLHMEKTGRYRDSELEAPAHSGLRREPISEFEKFSPRLALAFHSGELPDLTALLPYSGFFGKKQEFPFREDDVKCILNFLKKANYFRYNGRSISLILGREIRRQPKTFHCFVRMLMCTLLGGYKEATVIAPFAVRKSVYKWFSYNGYPSVNEVCTLVTDNKELSRVVMQEYLLHCLAHVPSLRDYLVNSGNHEQVERAAFVGMDQARLIIYKNVLQILARNFGDSSVSPVGAEPRRSPAWYAEVQKAVAAARSGQRRTCKSQKGECDDDDDDDEGEGEGDNREGGGGPRSDRKRKRGEGSDRDGKDKKKPKFKELFNTPWFTEVGYLINITNAKKLVTAYVPNDDTFSKKVVVLATKIDDRMYTQPGFLDSETPEAIAMRTKTIQSVLSRFAPSESVSYEWLACEFDISMHSVMRLKEAEQLYSSQISSKKVASVLRSLSKNAPRDYHVLKTFFTQLNHRKSIRLYSLPLDMTLAQIGALHKLYQTAPGQPLHPEAGMFYFCTNCLNFKASLVEHEDASAKNLSFRGSKGACIDTMTMEVRCAKRPSKAYKKKSQAKERGKDARYFQKENVEEVKASRKKSRMVRSMACVKICESQPLAKLNMIGSLLVVEGKQKILLCPQCGSPTTMKWYKYGPQGLACRCRLEKELEDLRNQPPPPPPPPPLPLELEAPPIPPPRADDPSLPEVKAGNEGERKVPRGGHPGKGSVRKPPKEAFSRPKKQVQMESCMVCEVVKPLKTMSCHNVYDSDATGKIMKPAFFCKKHNRSWISQGEILNKSMVKRAVLEKLKFRVLQDGRKVFFSNK